MSARTRRGDGKARALERQRLLRAVDPQRILCPSASCRVTDDATRPLFYDEDHLSIPGGRFIEPELAEVSRGRHSG
jgi:hypothetical protein